MVTAVAVALNCSFVVTAVAVAHQGCVFAVLLPSLFFIFIAWHGKGQRREHERNENACVHLFEKLCDLHFWIVEF